MNDAALSFPQITTILDVTDRLGLDREWVEIPLSPEPGGIVHYLANGKLEIIVDSAMPFDAWLATLPARIHAVTDAKTGSSTGSGGSVHQ